MGPGAGGQFALPSDFPLLKGGMPLWRLPLPRPPVNSKPVIPVDSVPVDYSAERRQAYIKSGKFSLRTHTAPQ